MVELGDLYNTVLIEKVTSIVTVNQSRYTFGLRGLLIYVIVDVVSFTSFIY